MMGVMIPQSSYAATPASLDNRPFLGWQGVKPLPFFAVLLFGFGLWHLPTPEGLEDRTWHLFAIFVSTIFGIIAKPLPMGALAIVSLTACVATKTLTIQQSLGSFSSKVVWLVLFAFFIARGFVKTGLGSRISYFFIKAFGKNTLGLSYALVLSDLLLAPAVPSNTARGAGILFPIVSALNREQGSCHTKGTQRHLGAFLIKVIFHSNLITSAMFVTALAGNPLIVSLAADVGVEITWAGWATATIVPGLVNLAILPLFLYVLYPPDLKKTPEAPAAAHLKLCQMGRLGFEESSMLATFIGLLGLWIFGQPLGIDATSAALIGLAALLLTGVLTWDDLLQEKSAWGTLMWFAILLMMAGQLTKMGMVTWFSGQMEGVVLAYHWGVAFVILSLVYLYSHYLFASATAHISSMYSAFLAVMIAAGTPPHLAAMSLAVLSSLCACLTHYGTGTAPVYYGAGYVPVADWWRLGGLTSLLHLSIWALVGGVWWKILKIW